MRRHAMMLADPDRAYTEAFAAYVATAMTGLSVEIRAMCAFEEVIKRLADGDEPLAVISERFLPQAEASVRAAAGRGRSVIVLTEGIHRSPLEGIPAVSKYQSAPEMMRRVLKIYATRPPGEEKPVIKTDMLVVGVYSPAGRCLKSSLAMAVGQVLSENRPTLLMDLESQAAYMAWFDRAYMKDISDLAVSVMERQPHFAVRLAACVEHVGALDYIPPFTIGLDAPDVPEEVWPALIGQIRENTAYEALVIDVGESVCGLRNILKLCDTVLMPCPDDPAAKIKIADYLQMMDLWDDGLKEKFAPVDISGLGLCGLGVEAPEALSEGPLGAIARNLVGQMAGGAEPFSSGGA